MVSEQRSRNMVEDTRLSQLSEIIHHLQEVTTKLTMEQSIHGILMEGNLQQLNNLFTLEILTLCVKSMVEFKQGPFDWTILDLLVEILVNSLLSIWKVRH